MMSAATWIYNLLKDDTTIKGKISDRIYRDVAPEKTGTPFIVYQKIDGTPVTNAFADILMNTERWQVKIVDDGFDNAEVETLAGRVKSLMHKASASGVVSCELLVELPRSELEAGVNYKSVVLDFRVYTL